MCRVFVLGVMLLGAAPAVANIDFQVFFLDANTERLDPEQWRITAEADAVISEAAAGFKADGQGCRILLAGYDQRVGREEDAIVRSLRRAEAVRDHLITKGVPAEKLAVKACGWSQQLERTPQGVRAPINRRVFFWWACRQGMLEEVSLQACAD
jgi:outer membrane protein OmpA-like peptidoglycan-associated protein